MNAPERLERIPGWESRLAVVLESARRARYQLGHHDCFSVACGAVAALTGVNHWPAFIGRYSTRREALRLIAQYGGSFDDAFSALWRAPTEQAALARRGDIVKYVDVEPHLGVCVGSSAAVLGEEGLLFAPLSECERCWRIG